MKGGFFILPRGLRGNPVFGSEPFNRYEAWLWLIEEASYQPETLGQIRHSTRFLARAWGWNAMRVSRFVHALQRCCLIATASDTDGLVITICNYEQFQLPANPIVTGGDTGTLHEPLPNLIKKEVSYIGIAKAIPPSKPVALRVVSRFEEFWLECPRKVGKAAAEKAYVKALRQVSHDELVAAMRNYSAARRGYDKQYTAHPTTWLNQGRWADEVETGPQASGPAKPWDPADRAAYIAEMEQELERRVNNA